MVKSSDIPETKDFMNRLWTFVKEFYQVSEYDEYWERLADEADKMPGEFDNYFSRSCILGFVGWREDELRKRTNKKKATIALIRHFCEALTDDEIRHVMEQVIKNRHLDLRVIPKQDPEQMTLDDIWRDE